MVLCDVDQKALDRLIVLGHRGLPHEVRAKGQRNAAGIAVFIGKDLRLPVGPKHHRGRRIKIVSPVFLCMQGRNQISRKSCPCKQARVRFPAVCCFHDLEGLFDHLVWGGTVPLNDSGKLPFVAADQIILGFIGQVTGWRGDLLYEIFSQIQAVYLCFSLFIRGQRCYLFPNWIKDSGLCVRMKDVLPCIQPIDRMLQRSVSLGYTFACFFVHFHEADRCTGPFIGKCMGKGDLRLTAVCCFKPESVCILLIF